MINVLCYGDSNTWGYMPGSGTRYPVEQRWTTILQKQLGIEYHICDFGLCGMNTGIDDDGPLNRNGKRLLPEVLAAFQPLDLFIVMLGTNDWKTDYHTSTSQTGENIGEMIQYIKSTYPQMRIILASPAYVEELIITDAEFDSGAVAKSKDTELVLETVANREKVTFFQTSLFDIPVGPDGCHFTVEGHRRFADAMTICVGSVME